MKKIVHTLACIAALLISQSSIADPYYNWAKRLGDAGANVDVGKAIYSDQNGNVYLTGYFKGAVDFDPSNGVSLLTSGGTAENIFFAKYTANGKLSWAKQIGDANKSAGLAIQTDDTGNVYLLSNFELSLSIDYDPGAGTSNMTGQGFKTIVLSKYTSNGDYVWAKSINGNADNYAHSMRLDEAGNIFIAGRFDGITDFDPSAAAATLTSIGAYNGFFAKYTNQGNYMWANQLSGVISGEIDVNDLTLDNLGNLYLSGNYKTSCDFDPSPATTIRSNDGNSDFYVGKYTENGVLLWAIALDGTNDDYAR
ncbi:MAG: SBBP repeat-containing protein [Bacteroidetes bacterium]|nr:SBBP repeat-containing protein [Bacteroidota bacterium]